MKKKAKNSFTKETNSSVNTSSGLDISMLNVSGKCARDDTEMFVTVGVGKKKHFCMYYNTFQSKIIRHFERGHGNGLEVRVSSTRCKLSLFCIISMLDRP